MLTSKQRAFLRGLAGKTNAVFQIGKSDVSPEIVKAIDEHLEANELVKISLLESCESSPREAADMLMGRTRSEVVQVIGRKVVLYRQSMGKQKIELPKE